MIYGSISVTELDLDTEIYGEDTEFHSVLILEKLIADILLVAKSW